MWMLLGMSTAVAFKTKKKVQLCPACKAAVSERVLCGSAILGEEGES